MPNDNTPNEFINGAADDVVEVNAEINAETDVDLVDESAAINIKARLPIDVSLPANLPAALIRAATNNPNNGLTFISSIDEEKFLSYADLLSHAQNTQRSLAQGGLQPGDCVILKTEDNWDFVVAFWGCVLGGYLPVPVASSPTYTQQHQTLQRLKAIWEKLGAPLIIASCSNGSLLRDAADSFLGMSGHKVIAVNELVSVDHVSVDSGDEINSESERQQVNENETCLLLLTSGSTGVPKAVELSHKGILSRARARAKCFDFSVADVALNWLPLDHVASLVMFHIRDVFLGCQQVHVATHLILAEPLLWPEYINRYRVSMTWAPSFAFKLVNDQFDKLANPDWDLSCMRCLLNGGEAVDRQVALQFLDNLGSYGMHSECLLPDWGMSETSSGIVQPVPLIQQASDSPFVEVGSPIAGVGIRIVDAQNEVITENQVGMVQVKSTTLMNGYYQDPERTAESFTEDGWLKTGDLGLLRNGRLTITGRDKDVIIIKGANIAPQEIETLVRAQWDNISTVAAIAVQIEKGTPEKLAVFFEFEEGEDKDKELGFLFSKIRSSMTGQLGLNPDYLLPLAVDSLPRTSIGKVQRSSVKNLFLVGEYDALIKFSADLEKSSVRRSAAVATTPVQKKLLKIFSEVLKQNDFGVEDNIFNRGGDSLLVTKAVARIVVEMDANIRLQDIFSCPTVSQLANLIDHRNSIAAKGSEKERNITSLQDFLSVDGAIENAPIAPNQYGLWVIQQLRPESAAYNIYQALEIAGDLDVNAWRASLQAVVDRHAALRTVFVLKGQQPCQKILENAAIKLPEENLQHLSVDEAELEGHRLSIELISRPFELSEGPLLRASLIQLTQSRHLFVLCMHHINCDGHSLHGIVQELLDTYAYRSASVESNRTVDSAQLTVSALPSMTASSASSASASISTAYAGWQQARLSEARGDELRGFWQQKMTPAPLALDFPTDKTHPRLQSYQGATFDFNLSPALSSSVSELAQKFGSTFFMVLMAAYQLLLMRYSGQKQLCVGTPVAGRTDALLEGAIGFFVNTVAVRGDCSENPTFSDFLRNICDEAVAGFDHQELPLNQILETSGIKGELSRTPVYQAMLILDEPPALKSPVDLDIKRYETHNDTAKFELTLFVEKFGEGMQCALEYNSDLFDQATAEQLCQHFENILEAIVCDPQQRVMQIPLLSPQERERLLSDLNPAQTPFPKEICIHQLISAQVAKTPSRPAVAFGSLRLDYEQLNQQANQLAHYLLEKGVKPGIPVAVCVSRSNELSVALLAVLKTGGCYVPLDPAWPQKRLDYMLENSVLKSSVSLVVSEESLGETWTVGNVTPVFIDRDAEAIRGCSTSDPEVQVSSSDLAYIIYTSGSTGRPKGVEVTHRSVINFLQSMKELTGINEHDKLLAVTTPCFDISVLELFLPLTVGACTVIADGVSTSDGRTLAETIKNSAATIMQATPATWRLLLESGWSGEERLKILCGGEALSSSLADSLLQSGQSVLNLYGPTETTVWSAACNITDAQTVTIGKPIGNTQIYILDDHMQPVPQRVFGEIYIGGEGVTRGYHDRPELTEQVFIADVIGASNKSSGEIGARLYKTGDYGRYNYDGTIEYLGRRDQQIKLRGFRIEIGEIEAVLLSHENVQQAAVALQETSTGTQGLVAYVVYVSEPASDSSLKEHLASRLPTHMVPRLIMQMDQLPLTPNLKVDRKALPLPKFQSISSGQDRPSDDTERMLMRLFEKTLKRSGFGIHDGFFDLGGDSLLAVTLVTAVEKESGKRLHPSNLLHSPTVAGLASKIHSGVFTLEPIAGTSSLPIMFLIPPAGSTNLAYVHVAKNLGDHYCLYALDYPGLENDDTPLKTVTDIAAHFVEQIRELQPVGPYKIVGRCFGGLVAYDIARLLQEKYDQAAQVVLIDTTLQTLGPMDMGETRRVPSKSVASQYVVKSVNIGLGLFDEVIQRLFYRDSNSNNTPIVGRVDYVHENFSVRLALRRLVLGFTPRGRRINRVWRANLAAVRSYQPRSAKVKIDFIMSHERKHNSLETEKWLALSSDQSGYHIISGSNHSTLHHESFAAPIAKTIRSVFVKGTAENFDK